MGEYIMNKFPEIVKKLRKENKLTQQQLANFLNLSQRTYAHYEAGDREPSIETILLIANYFKVSTDYLLGRYTLKDIYEVREINKEIQIEKVG
jgi:transcriptional regulator with XRE-family HTH domain